MEYTTLVPEVGKAQESVEKYTFSLYEICQQVMDGRAARGIQYELAALLVLQVLAKLAGMKSLSGASDWIRDQEKRLCEYLQLSWKRMSCANTYKYAASASGQPTGEYRSRSLVGAL